ncbi:MAG TPA: nuclear transport factor 2 family protein [Baekduia sp.]|uniref:nuclear transport factor 2 family protein n=1 Tax=Baekduia sp. TaxID=2600305 RepID=UPI002BA9C63C|nr:nuclear transport factor 2 family protein [Baekduia sp.]HMJ33932.1 nuclear transport factor 2 family protein [Baekduia sp.]
MRWTRPTLLASLVAVLSVPTAIAVGAGGHSKAGHDGYGGGAVQQAVAKHIAALAACDADALVAGYTDDAKLFFPDGVVVSGRSALQELYAGFVKPRSEGGLCGLKAEPVDQFKRGTTVFVKFKVTAPFLAAPYFSTDGYVFDGRRIASEISTFDASKLKFI